MTFQQEEICLYQMLLLLFLNSRRFFKLISNWNVSLEILNCIWQVSKLKLDLIYSGYGETKYEK